MEQPRNINRHHDTCPKCLGTKRTVARLCRKCRDREVYRGTPGQTKACTKCNVEKGIAEFRVRSAEDPRPRPACRACEADIQRQRYAGLDPKTRKRATREWEKNNPQRHQAQKNRRKFRSKGIEPTPELLSRLESQSRCDICGDEVSGYLHIDHDHQTSTYRGLLCGNCNVGIGHFLHQTYRLSRAIEYLQRTSQG